MNRPDGTGPSMHVQLAHQPVVDQGDAANETWMSAGGDPRDRGRLAELISADLVGSERLMVGLAWLGPGEVHLLHHHPHADEWYYVVRGSALFTVGNETVRGAPGSALFIPTGVRHGIHNDDPQEVEFLWGFDQPRLDTVGIVWDE